MAGSVCGGQEEVRNGTFDSQKRVVMGRDKVGEEAANDQARGHKVRAGGQKGELESV